MAPTTERVVRPPLESVREAPFALVRDSGDGEPNDGLTLDGYGAVFNRETIIDSWEGRFREQIAAGSMKRSFRETPPKIQFDHGRHPMIGSIPIAELRSISEDTDPVLAPDGGAHIVGRVFDNWLMQPVRDAIAAGAIDGMSFRFSVVREGWAYADGRPIRDDSALMAELSRCMYDEVPDEELPVRTLKELKVPEIGPVTWPAYADTSVGMRSVIDLGRIQERDPEQLKLLARAVFIADTAEKEDDSQQPTVVGERQSTTESTESDTQQVAERANDAARKLVEAQERLAKAQRAAAEAGREACERMSQDVQQDADLAVKRPSQGRNDAQRSTPVGERPSKPRNLGNKELRLRNQRDRLLNLRTIGERP